MVTVVQINDERTSVLSVDIVSSCNSGAHISLLSSLKDTYSHDTILRRMDKWST